MVMASLKYFAWFQKNPIWGRPAAGTCSLWVPLGTGTIPLGPAGARRAKTQRGAILVPVPVPAGLQSRAG